MHSLIEGGTTESQKSGQHAKSNLHVHGGAKQSNQSTNKPVQSAKLGAQGGSKKTGMHAGSEEKPSAVNENQSSHLKKPSKVSQTN